MAHQSDVKAQILAILQEDLSPWTFNGTEPMCQRLFKAVEGFRPLDDRCTCGHKREGHHVWGPCHNCKCTLFVLSEPNV